MQAILKTPPIPHEQELQSAKLYYHDFYTNQRKIKFTQKTHDFNLIRKATAPDTPITRKEQDVLANISNMILRSPNGIIAMTSKEFSKLTENKKWQNNIIRKHLSHIIFSKHKKTVVIDGGVKHKVIVFNFTETGEEILRNIEKHYSEKTLDISQLQQIGAGGRPPAPLYKDKKNIKRNRSSESNFLNDSFSSSEKKLKTSKPAKPQKIRKFYQNQYYKPKTLPEESQINDQEEAEIYKLSGRMYEKEAMNEILKNMVKRGLQKLFHSRRQFIVWFSKCMLNELRSVEHTNKVGFYIKGNKTQIEQEQIKTNAEQKIFLGSFEQTAIDLPCPENQLKAKWANVLPTNQGYNFLFNLKMMRLNKETLQIYLAKKIDLWDNTKHNILKEAKAVGDFMYTEKIEFIL